MIPKRGYFQPLDITGQIGWLWWLILFMAGIILWSETTFKLEMVPIVYLLLMLALGIIIILRRRVYVAGAQLFLGRVFVSDYEKISLTTMVNWQLNGRVLSFTRAGRSRKYWLSQNIAKQIKEYMTTHDKKDNN
ncbi:EbsA family protein [Leuconostoc gelidum]|uniref:EbsA family protein n=1 Tax=Leuconostoc gelidum TaxID=1244 RepID=UPI001C7DA2EA|nr:EbsA family protein [Leuconostoc gelidum]MBZ6010679.1 hypothetical protein [Leuconostoc gelidum subsp. aenigmaticum]